MKTEKKKTKVDLVTGFLGAGKTTFIKKYARYLLDKGCKIGVLENDFGAVNVDMLLLQELLDENCDLEMVSAADKDCHRRRFKTKLIAMGMRGLDRVIVEPSGIYEADEFFDVLREEPLDNWYEIGSVITIADACLDTNLSEASDYLLASQLSEAGIVLMSKCQEATKQELEDTLKHTSLYFMNMKLPDNAMEDAVSRLMSDSKCGKIFRVKGFMQNAEGKWLELNATHKNITVKPIERGQAVFIVIGEGLDKEHIDGYFVPV